MVFLLPRWLARTSLFNRIHLYFQLCQPSSEPRICAVYSPQETPSRRSSLCAVGTMMVNLKFRALLEQAAERALRRPTQGSVADLSGIRTLEILPRSAHLQGPHPELWP